MYGIGKKNPTLAAPFSQGNICQNCRFFVDGWGIMTALTLCRISGRKALGNDAACPDFLPTAENSHLTSGSGGGIVGFPNYARPCHAFGFPQKLKRTAFLFFAIFRTFFRLRAHWRNVLEPARAKRSCVDLGAFRLFSCPKTVNLKEVLS